MRTHIALAALLLIPVTARSQQQPAAANPATTPAPVEAKLAVDPSKKRKAIPPSSSSAKAHFTGSALKPLHLPRRQGTRPPGQRPLVLRSRRPPANTNSSPAPKNEPATLIETVAGQTTYVQMIVVTGNWRGGGRLLQAAPADAQKSNRQAQAPPRLIALD